MRQLGTLFLITVVSVAQFGLSAAAQGKPGKPDKGELAQKPLMGWSSYSLQVYNENGIDWVTADRVKTQSDAMHKTLQKYGYDYINIDAGWSGGFDDYGRPTAKASLYPNGIQDVINYVHHNGQKIGLYTIPGVAKEVYDQNLPIYGTPYHARDIVVQPLTTADYWGINYKIDFSKPGAKEYIKSIADQFGKWGIDFLKFDSVTPGSGINNTSIDARDDVKAWSEALKPYNIWLELSWALDINYADYWKQYANGWRIEWDIESYSGPGTTLTKWENIARLFPAAAKWARVAGSGGWNDFDSLDVGNGSMDGLTQDERRTAMTFWAVSAAQLYIGDDMTKLDSFGLSLLTNPEVIAVNQAGHPAHPVSIGTDQQVWYSNNGDGTFNVALFNLGDSPAAVKVNWSDIGLDGKAAVRDLWSRSDLGTFTGGLDNIVLQPHASRLFKVTALNGKASVNDDESGMSYTGSWVRNNGQEQAAGSQNLVVDIADSSAASAGKATQTDAASTGTADSNATANPNAAADLNAASLDGSSGLDAAAGSNATTDLGAATDPNAATDLSAAADLNASADPNGVAGANADGSSNPDASLQADPGNDGQANPDAFSQTDPAANPDAASATMQQTVPQVVYINDTDPGIVYGKEAGTGSGSWGYNSGRPAEWNDYQGDVHYGEHGEVTFEYPFTGTGIEFLSEQDNSGGDIDIYLDGQWVQTVSANGTPHLGQFSVYQVSGLSDGPHTLKGVKKGGDYLIVDGFKVTADSLLGSSAATYDKNDPQDLNVSLTLGSDSFTGIFNGDTELVQGTDYIVQGNTVTIRKAYLQKQQPGETDLTFRFAEDAAQTLNIQVVQAVDNSDISPVEAGFDKRASQQQDIQVALTLNGNTLAGIWNGTNSLTENTDYTVDDSAVTISKAYLAKLPNGVTNLTFKFSAGASANLAVTVTDTAGAERYRMLNDDDAGIHYSDGWSTNGGRGFGDYMDNVHYSENNGEYFEYTFNGVGIQYITELDPSQGDVDIYLDGQFQQTVSTYAPVRSAQQVVYQTAGLSNGSHTLKAVKKSGRFMLVDALKVQLPDLLGATSAVFDLNPAAQRDIAVDVLGGINDLEGIYNGSARLAAGTDYTISGSTATISKAYLATQAAGTVELTFAFKGDYQDDIHYTETNGDYYEYTFRGTGISIVGPTGPDLGLMKVYIDGRLQTTVNAGGSVRSAQQPLFSISRLQPGTHTIKVVKASGLRMMADKLVFDVTTSAGPGHGH